MPQPHAYTASHRSPKLKSQQKYLKTPVDSIFSSHSVETETVNRANNHILLECRTIDPDYLSRKDRDGSNPDLITNSAPIFAMRPSLTMNLRLTISNPSYNMASQESVEHITDEDKALVGNTGLNKGLPFGSTNNLNLTWLSPINKIEVEDSEADDSRSYPSFQESIFLDDLSPIYAPKSFQKVSDESKALLEMFNTSSYQKPKQSQDTNMSYKDESQHLLKTNHLGEAFSKDISTDLSIEIHQIDNVTKRQESEDIILSENDMILDGLNLSSIDQNSQV